MRAQRYSGPFVFEITVYSYIFFYFSISFGKDDMYCSPVFFWI